MASPHANAPRIELADWLELAAFASPHRCHFLSNLRGDFDFDQEEELEDTTTYDTVFEDALCRATQEIDYRRRTLEDSYPFEIDQQGNTLRLNREFGLGGTIYLFCLILSDVGTAGAIDRQFIPAIDNNVRDLFQVCATLCAAGSCGGPAYSFGWPRPDGSQLLPKLREIYALFGEGTVRNEPLLGSPVKVKDDGIDVIAWRHEADGLPGKKYLLGQAASGKNWVDKGIRENVAAFHNEWFTEHPSSVPTPTIFIPFIPFCREPEADDEFSYEDLLHGLFRRFTERLGHLSTRYRIPFYASRAPSLAAAGVSPIERLDDADKIGAWVIQVREMLIRAEAE